MDIVWVQVRVWVQKSWEFGNINFYKVKQTPPTLEIYLLIWHRSYKLLKGLKIFLWGAIKMGIIWTNRNTSSQIVCKHDIAQIYVWRLWKI